MNQLVDIYFLNVASCDADVDIKICHKKWSYNKAQGIYSSLNLN